MGERMEKGNLHTKRLGIGGVSICQQVDFLTFLQIHTTQIEVRNVRCAVHNSVGKSTLISCVTQLFPKALVKMLHILPKFIPGKTEWRFWAELSAHINSIWAEFVRKNSSMVPHPPCTSPFRCFSDHMFMDSTYFLLLSAHIVLVLSCRVLQ